LIVALAAAAVLLGLALLAVRVRRRFGARLIIAAFTGGTDEKTGPATSVAVGENYGRLCEQAGGRPLRLVASSAVPLPEMPKEAIEAYSPGRDCRRPAAADRSPGALG
jgi:hypothetical protein